MHGQEFPSIDSAVGHFFNLDEMLTSGDPVRLETARNWVAIHVARGVFKIRNNKYETYTRECNPNATTY